VRRLAAAALMVATACADPPLLEAPEARAVAVARTADLVALAEELDRAGLVDASLVRAAGPALVAQAPVIASLVGDGVVILSTWVDRKAGLALVGTARPVLGKTQAVRLDERQALVRVDRRRVLAAIGVPEGKEATIAALLEVMAAEGGRRTPAMPDAGIVQVRVGAGVLPIDVGELDARVRVVDHGVHIDAKAPAAPAAVRDALASEAPSWSCGLEEGAAAVVHAPPLAGVTDDAFRGRVLIAAYPPAQPGARPTLAMAGAPSDARVGAEMIATMLEAGGREREVKGRRVVEVLGETPLRVMADTERLVLVLGDERPLEKLDARRACSSSALVRADGTALAGMLLPLLVSGPDAMRALATGDIAEALPFAPLRGIARVEVDAERAAAGILFRARLGLRAVPD
jgi:hypothetical protein